MSSRNALADGILLFIDLHAVFGGIRGGARHVYDLYPPKVVVMLVPTSRFDASGQGDCLRHNGGGGDRVQRARSKCDHGQQLTESVPRPRLPWCLVPILHPVLIVVLGDIPGIPSMFSMMGSTVEADI
jgi:hypothetical protein